MKLSEINPAPKYSITIPSTGKRGSYRPFLVKEEKALLAAQESEKEAVMLATLDQVVKACVTPDTITENLTSFDLEYLFTLIRAKSVGEISELVFRCDVCTVDEAKAHKLVDLTKVAVVTPKEHKRKIQLSDTVVVAMKYPTVDDLVAASGKDNSDELLLNASLDKVYAGDDVFNIAEESKEEIQSFMDSLNSKQRALIDEFFDTMPYTSIPVEYECPVCHKIHSKELKGINNFF